MGVLAFELMTGKAPFYHASKKETMKKILNVPLNSLRLKTIALSIQGICQHQLSISSTDSSARNPDKDLKQLKLLNIPSLIVFSNDSVILYFNIFMNAYHAGSPPVI